MKKPYLVSKSDIFLEGMCVYELVCVLGFNNTKYLVSSCALQQRKVKAEKHRAKHTNNSKTKSRDLRRYRNQVKLFVTNLNFFLKSKQ